MLNFWQSGPSVRNIFLIQTLDSTKYKYIALYVQYVYTNSAGPMYLIPAVFE